METEEHETVLEEQETWRLEYSYGSPGLSLGISYTPCNSLEECKAQFAYMVEHCGMPLWANAVHNIDKVMVKTFVLKLIEPKG
jgi:hypothetical protein